MKMSQYRSQYLNAEDVKKPTAVTVREVIEENVGGKDKAVIYFEELGEGMALSKTAIIQLEEIFGTDESDDWIGQQCVIFNDRSVMYQGKKVGGLRFRALKNGEARPTPSTRRRNPTSENEEGQDTPFE